MKMKIIIFSFVSICVYVGIHQVQGVPEKVTTPPTDRAEYDGHDKDKDQDDEGDSADLGDVSSYLTPECRETLKKHRSEIENLKNLKENRREEANKVTQKLADGGCKPMLDYLAKKMRNKG